MKFRLIFILLIFSFFKALPQNFNGGLIFGGTATQISGDQLGGYNKLGIDMGAFVNLNTGKYTALEFELKYVQKGSKSRFSIFDTNVIQRKIYRLRLNYIEMPVVFKYELKGISKYESYSSFHLLNKLVVEIGLSYGVLLSSKEEDATGNFDLYSPPFNSGELSLMCGIYFKVNENLKISFRRSVSLLPVRKHSGDATYRLNMGQYNDVVELTLHYQFHKHNE